MKKLFSIMLVLAMLFSLFGAAGTAAFADGPDGEDAAVPFHDLPADAPPPPRILLRVEHQGRVVSAGAYDSIAVSHAVYPYSADATFFAAA